MANLQISNIDLRRVAVTSEGLVCRDGDMAFAGADEIDEGTLLAIDSVSGEYVLWVSGGVTNENGIIKAVMQAPLSVAGASTVAIRPIVGGQVVEEMLKEDGGTALTVADLDGLRDFGIQPVSVEELCKLDNQ